MNIVKTANIMRDFPCLYLPVTHHFRFSHSQPAIKNRIEYLLTENRVAICDIIRLEILGRARTEKEFSILKSRLDSLHHLETRWDDACELAFTLRRKGVVVPYTDILIAASAIYAGTILFHFDRHFDLIAGITNLFVESVPTPLK